MNHQQVWKGIDLLAASRGLTASGMAIESGLDPTALNLSKRFAASGKPRWPSTETLSLLFMAMNSSIDEFTRLLKTDGAPRKRDTNGRLYSVTIDLSKIVYPPYRGREYFAHDGKMLNGGKSYMLRITNNSLAPRYERNSTLVLSMPDSFVAGNRVIAFLKDNTIIIGQIQKTSANNSSVTIKPFTSEELIKLNRGQLSYMHKIEWARQ